VIGAAVAGLVVAAAAACSLPQQSVAGQAAPEGAGSAVGPARSPSPLDEEGPLVPADLAAVDRDRLLDEFLLAVTTQPVLHVRMELVGDVPSFLAGQEYNHGFVEGGFDFRSHEYAYLEEYGFRTLCTGGVEYGWDSFDLGWEEEGDCTITPGAGMQSAANTLELTGKVGDGVLTAGLTPQEADIFVRAMREQYPGFLQVGEPSLVERDDAQYVRLPVVFAAVGLGGGGELGVGIFNYAFRDIGPRYETHVLSPGTAGASVDQVEAVYYLDPKTRLPAYSEVLIYDPAGDPAATTGSITRTEYLWDGEVPRYEPTPATPPAPPPPSWPAEKLAPAGPR
jgi:hypothetical protein